MNQKTGINLSDKNEMVIKNLSEENRLLKNEVNLYKQEVFSLKQQLETVIQNYDRYKQSVKELGERHEKKVIPRNNSLSISIRSTRKLPVQWSDPVETNQSNQRKIGYSMPDSEKTLDWINKRRKSDWTVGKEDRESEDYERKPSRDNKAKVDLIGSLRLLARKEQSMSNLLNSKDDRRRANIGFNTTTRGVDPFKRQQFSNYEM